MARNGRKAVIIAAFLIAIAVIMFFSSSASAGNPICTTGDCQFMPATFTTDSIIVEKSHGHSKSSKTITVKQIKKKIRKFEKRKNVIVAIHMKANGLKSGANCVDPTRKDWGFHVGSTFTNTRSNGGPFSDSWEYGWKICNWRIVKKHGRTWVTGTKQNCGNANIWIPIDFKIKPKKLKKSIEIKSYVKFYEKYISKKTVDTNSTSESEHVYEIGSYTCPPGWILVNAKLCKYCPPPHCEEYECPPGNVWNGYKCVKDGDTTPQPPPECSRAKPPAIRWTR